MKCTSSEVNIKIFAVTSFTKSIDKFKRGSPVVSYANALRLEDEKQSAISGAIRLCVGSQNSKRGVFVYGKTGEPRLNLSKYFVHGVKRR
jgi:hypothetical protein